MKTLITLILVSILALTLTGCNKSENSTSKETPPPAPAQSPAKLNPYGIPVYEKLPPAKNRPQNKDNF
jgi:hypothetical protein